MTFVIEYGTIKFVTNVESKKKEGIIMENKTPCYFYKEENAIVFENTWNDDDDFKRDLYELKEVIGYDEDINVDIVALKKIFGDLSYYGFAFGNKFIDFPQIKSNVNKLEARICLISKYNLKYKMTMIPFYFSKEEFIEHFSKSKNPLKELKESLEGVFTE